MVRAIHSDRKGIYRDLYRTIESENKTDDQSKRQRKGIYVALYSQLEEQKQNVLFKSNKSQEEKNILNNRLIGAAKKGTEETLSKVSYFISAVASKFKIFLFAFVVAKKPIMNYMERKLEPVSNDRGNYYND